MQLHVHHQGNQIGPFTPEAVAEMVRLGTLGPDASVWHEGLPDWVPVNEFLQQLPAPAAPAAVATPAAAANADGPSELSVVLKALACGLVVALVAGVIFGVIEAKLGDATRGARRILGWLLAGLGWLVGFTVSRVSRGYDSWLLVGGAAASALVGLLFSVWVAGAVGGDGGPTVFGSIFQIVIGTAIAGYVAKAD
jgi:hypothetical protein